MTFIRGLAKNHRSSAETIRNLIRAGTGRSTRSAVQVRSGATLSQARLQIRRDDVQRRVVIQTNVEGRDMGSLVSELTMR